MLKCKHNYYKNMKVNQDSVIKKYLKLSKLRVVELLLVTTVPSMIISIYGMPPLSLVIYTLSGGTILAISANVMNQVFEVETDKLMQRTADRPIVTGEISKINGVIFSVFCGLSGFIILYTLATTIVINVTNIVLIWVNISNITSPGKKHPVSDKNHTS